MKELIFVMDNTILDVLHTMAQSRYEFFNQRTIRLVDYQQRGVVMRDFMRSEMGITDLIARLYTQQQTTDIANSIVRLTVPSRFLEPVRVVATNEQIIHSLVPRDSQDSPCAICQEPISSGGVVLRHCSHGYHQTCISSWFSTSVRCPVCRHDIRETGQANQTSSGVTGT